jgi:coproporphyrinogen III oxidase
VLARSAAAAEALELVEDLQRRFVASLEAVAADFGEDRPFSAISWLRDAGRHGGGTRRVHGDGPVFNRASVNVSQVHYDDEPARRLGSATALSTIIHPMDPHAPSVHAHISWTELRDGTGSWRLMADLNPALEDPGARDRFVRLLAGAFGQHAEQARAQGDRYFFIPVLGRHRGVAHFYLEGHRTPDPAADVALARAVGDAVVDGYPRILAQALAAGARATEADRQHQLTYHTLYAFQVLTLDRGTTSGLLVHDQNDVGILGSLPARVDRDRLASWIPRMPAPQDALLARIVDVLPPETPSPVTEDAKRALAEVIRDHYRAHPEALDLQAAGDIVPPTVANHRVS